ncbi:pre-mRNA-splicing factor cwc2-like isoform X1 [Pogonomyrmex barbatus]|uniref:Pre-mRNA-splicing factor cwc2-like isoform X1 n=1 Tax=Pogonomyrmex barbatus TaxID=144034 RepID=A0A6I9WVQ0_9HYME|nr:pre-mRNA-splicing factor cwc2-like isoform X1 [Pogonomyrmex barbatus]
MTKLRLCLCIFVLLSMLLILSRIRITSDNLDCDFPRPASAILIKNIHLHDLYVEPIFYGESVQSPQRRLLEHPRRAKQVYRNYDYSVVRRHRQPRNKLDEGRFYRSSVVNNDDDEDEEEKEEEEDQNSIDNDNDNADEEITGEDEEETVTEEPDEIYDYETEMRNVASQDAQDERRLIFFAKMLSVSLLIFSFV